MMGLLICPVVHVMAGIILKERLIDDSPSGILPCSVDITGSKFMFVPGESLRNCDDKPRLVELPTYHLTSIVGIWWLAGVGKVDLSDLGYYKPIDAPSVSLANTTTGQMLSYVVKGETYDVNLEGFETGKSVYLRVVLESGLEFPIAIIPSFEGPSQSWPWTVGVLLPAGDFISIKAYQQDKVAYTPEVLVEATPLEDSFTSFMDNLNLNPQSATSSTDGSIHPSIPDTLERLKSVLMKNSGTRRRSRRRKYRSRRRRRGRRVDQVRSSSDWKAKGSAR